MHLHNQATFQEKEYVFFDSTTVIDFLDFLKDQAALFAPHRKGENSFIYKKVVDSHEVVLNYPRTIQPLKKFFLPPQEALLKFKLSDNSYEKPELHAQKRIFFGVHSYEMQGIRSLDYSFKKGNPESNFLTRREQATFIGISYTPDEYHFAKSVGIEIEKTDGMSLYFEPNGEGYFVFIIDDEGRKLIEEFGKADTSKKFPGVIEKEFKQKIKYHYNRLPQVFEQSYNADVWKKVAEKCVGCGTCNLLCSTCYCFDVRDEIELDAENGSRRRFWDGCMLNRFAEVAGGENFRGHLDSRTRHRLYRKFKYIHQESGELACVGCGRCSSFCPAGISITGIINDLIEDLSQKQLS